jgi:hypothetical protein
MSYTNFPNGVTSFGIPLPAAGRDISGSTYFVDNNSGLDSNDGSSWERAFKTFAKAVTISNLDIARGSDRWARRNTIYYCADTETATIVAFPNKCDVIGVGSYDANSKPGITGNHAPVNAGNYGTRFFNIWFKSPAVASPIITLASTSSGIQFIGCSFDGTSGTVTSAILATASPFLKVIDCEMFGAFATSYISLGTGQAASTTISGNMMTGSAGIGIIIASDTTSSYPSIVKDNIIVITDTSLCIDDDCKLFYYVNNRLINQGTVTAWAHHTAVADVNADFAVGNICVGSAGNQVTLGTTVGS